MNSKQQLFFVSYCVQARLNVAPGYLSLHLIVVPVNCRPVNCRRLTVARLSVAR